MIKISDLKERHNNKLKKHKDAKSLFHEDDTFNEHNWNGGEAVIRQFTGELDWCEGKFYNKDYSIRKHNKGIEGKLICTYSFKEDYNYVQITNHYYKWYINDETEWLFDQYLIMWYKNRGTTAMILKNGKPIKLKQYVKLLNIIEATGFKFNMDVN